MRAGRLSFLVPPLLLISAAQGQPAVTRPPPSSQPTSAQQADEIIIYRDRNFEGGAVTIYRNEPNLHLAWTVSSVRPRGNAWWELCERPNYQGTCLTVSSGNSDLGQRKVQSVRRIQRGLWREFGAVDVARPEWDRSVIRARNYPRLWAVRLCAEQNRVRLRDARAYFTNKSFQTLQVPAELASGACTDPLAFPTRRNLSSVEVMVSTGNDTALARIRLEGL